MAKSTRIRKGTPSVQLSKAEFTERLRGRFYDPAFVEVAEEIELARFASSNSATDRNRMHVSFSIGPMAVRVEQQRCPILSSPKLLPPPAIDR